VFLLTDRLPRNRAGNQVRRKWTG